jgi:predicted RNase H-like nuclease
MLFAGADGCPKGWIQITRDTITGAIESQCFPDAKTMVSQHPQPQVLTIDVPIGLLDAGARNCDREARAVLGRRKNSVFTAPLRPMLPAETWEEACGIRESIEGKRITKQVWGILPKVREVDELMIERSDLREWVHEVHPEVCFWAWKGEPMSHPKRKKPGRHERLEPVVDHFGNEPFQSARQLYYKEDVADDDILDAFAASVDCFFPPAISRLSPGSQTPQSVS